MTEPVQTNQVLHIDLKAMWQASDKLSLVSLLVANMLPIVFAVIFGWDAAGVVIFYWVENPIIGFWAIWRIVLASGGLMPVAQHGGKLFLVPFFIVHYYGFCLGHGIFIGVFFSGIISGDTSFDANPFRYYQQLFSDFGSIETWSVVIAVAGLFISHGLSYMRHYVYNGHYLQSHPIHEMFRPYGRIVLLHVCIIFGGMLVALLGAPIFMVVLLMLGKTLIDAAVHLTSHHDEKSGSIWERLFTKKQFRV